MAKGSKIRVYEFAKELGITNKALLDKLKKSNIDVKSHMSSLTNEDVNKVKSSMFGTKNSDLDEKRVKPSVIRRRKKKPVAEIPTEKVIPKSTIDSTEEKQNGFETGDNSVGKDEHVQQSNEESKPEKNLKQDSEETDVNLKGTSKSKKPNKRSRKKRFPKPSAPAKIIKPVVVVEPEEAKSVENKSVENKSVENKSVENKSDPKLSKKDDSKTVKITTKDSSEIKSEKLATPVSVTNKISEKELKSSNTVKAGIGENVKEDTSVKADGNDNLKKSEKLIKPVRRKKQKKGTFAKIIKLPTKESVQLTSDTKTGKTSNDTSTKPVFNKKKKQTVVTTEGDEGSKKAGKKGKTFKKKKWDGSEESDDVAKKSSKKKTSFRKRAVVEGKSLYGKNRFNKGRKGGKSKSPVAQKTLITTPKAIKRRIKVDDAIVLAEFAKRMGIKAADIIQKLMGMGVMATVNQTIDYETASLLAAEFDYEVEKASFEEDILFDRVEDTSDQLIKRSPVVTIMGHVDHGKTSLLDVIRISKIAGAEAGGITQHIGAYYVNTPNGDIVFLDTPGHEAFTAMRSRGAKVTDIVILVVAADDGVMPQTIEAINHSKMAEVPIIVAVNKMDKADADPDRVKRELSEHGVVAEEWGGDTIFVNVSAKQKTGIDDLLEMILLQVEVLELKSNPNKLAKGHVVEAKLDSGRGAVATILVQEGTLKTGDSVVCGLHYGKIRAMNNDMNQLILTAGPSMPVEIQGLSGVPEAGDELIALADEKNAKQISVRRVQKQRAKELAKSSRLNLEGLYAQLEKGEVKDINLIIKADVHGSIEALKDSLGKLSTDKVNVNIVHAATGAVSESDVSLATVSNGIILGFNVRPTAKVHAFAKEEMVDMRFYDIIYDAIKDIKSAMVGLMDSTFKEVVLGRAQVRDTFVIPKTGTIAGVYITDGKIQRGQNVRLLREGIIKCDGKLSSLKRFKDDVKEVQHGYECGMGIERYNDIKVGDVIECYLMEEIKPTLE